MIDHDERYLELFNSAVSKLESGLQDGGPPVDWERVLAFVDGVLDRAEASQVQAKILTYRSWYEARLEVYAAMEDQLPDDSSSSLQLPSRDDAKMALTLLLQEFDHHLQNQDFDIALRKMRDAVPFACNVFGFNSQEHAHMQARLSDVLFKIGERTEGETALKIALAVFEAADSKDPRIATGYLKMGQHASFQGHYRDAAFYVDKALWIRVAHDDFPGQANCLSELATVALQQNDIETAIHYATTSAKLQADATGEHSFEFAVKLDNLALVQMSISLEQAVQTFAISHHIFLSHATRHPLDLAICEDNFGNALYRFGKVEEGLALNQSALERFERLDHPSPAIVKCLANLGGKLAHSGDPHQGLALLTRAVNLPGLAQLDKKSQLTVDANLALALYLTGNTESARVRLEQTKQQLESLNCMHNELYCLVLNNLAVVLADIEKHSARKLLEGALKISLGRFGNTIPSNIARLSSGQDLEMLLAS